MAEKETPIKTEESILALLTQGHPPSPIYDFAALRIAAIIGSYGWLLLTPLPQPQRSTITLLLHAFTLYCILLYAWMVAYQRQVRRFNLLVLAIDLGFSLALIRLTGGVESPFFLALYLIAALQAYYYGLRRGVAVLVSSSLLYVMTVWPTWQPTSASIVALRLGFIILIVAPLVILSERERRRWRELEAVNHELEGKAARLEEVYTRQRDLQEHLENIMASITNGIIAVDLQGRITAWNRTMEVEYGIAATDVIGRRVGEAFETLAWEGVMEPLRGLLLGESDALHIREMEHQTEKKGRAILNIDGYPLRNTKGELQGAVLAIEDVTRHVALERQMRQTEKLSALGTLSAGLAHEINNPLGVITSRVELALMDAHEMEIPKQFIDDLKVIEKHAERATRVAKGLLSFSRPATGQLVSLDLNGVIEETLLLIEGQLEQERIVLERRLAPSLPKVKGNVSQLEEVLLNLFTNAREAMTAGGRLRVESRLGIGDASVQILIADTGEGIPDLLVQQIFDPFFTTKKSGTGLGLSISYGIVKEHGGRLDVKSETGNGTTFIMTLPAADV